MPTRTQTKRKPPPKTAEEVAVDATEPAEEMATKAEVQSLEEALRADLEVLAEKMVALRDRTKRMMAHLKASSSCLLVMSARSNHMTSSGSMTASSESMMVMHNLVGRHLSSG